MRRLVMVRLLLAAGLAVPLAGGVHAVADVGEPACATTPRPDPQLPLLIAERDRFGFHDEELVLCSPGYRQPVHLAARLFVPAHCPDVGGCPGVLVTHGFGFSKETTVADMQSLATRGFFVLSYDVRGQGASGGQAELMGRDEIADEAAALRWFHRYVRPTKTAVYGISQGGADAWMAAIYNCGAARAAHFDSTIPCDRGGRWVDAIIPMEGPTNLLTDTGTCDVFWQEATPEARFSDGVTGDTVRCDAQGLAPSQATDGLGRLDRNVTDYLVRASRIDVPAYVVTSFRDRLVPQQDIIRMWQLLRSRAADPRSDYAGTDVRLTISDEGHGAVGGNFAVLDDAFNWLQWEFGKRPSFRRPPVAIAQSWAGNAFRLERDWPVPGTVARTWWLSRAPSDPEANGRLTTSAPRGAEATDTLANMPVAASGPSGLPFAGDSVTVTSDRGVPDAQLVYLTAPLRRPMEVEGQPTISLWIQSSALTGHGRAQLHVALDVVSPDGTVTEFARDHRGFRDLGAKPVAVGFPLTVSSARLPAGSRLMLQITPTDVAVSLPFATADTVTVLHDARYPAMLRLPLAPINRRAPRGAPPTGPAFPQDAVAAVCKGIGLPCG